MVDQLSARSASRPSLARRLDLLLWRCFGQGAWLARRTAHEHRLASLGAGLAAFWLALTR